jgi:hypothetical protein
MSTTQQPNPPTNQNAPSHQVQPSQPPGWGPPPSPAPNPPPAPGAWSQPPAGPGQPPQGYDPRYRGHVPPGYGQGPAAQPQGPAEELRTPVWAALGAGAWRLVIGGLALNYAATGKEETMSSESLSYLSNHWTGLAFLALGGYAIIVGLLGGREPAPWAASLTTWLRAVMTVTMLLVGFVFVLGFGEDPDGPHAVIPILVLLDWLFVGKGQFRVRWWQPPTWTVFLLWYLWYHQTNDVPLYPEILGDDEIGTMVPLFLAGTIVMGYLLWGLVAIRKAVSPSTRR